MERVAALKKLVRPQLWLVAGFALVTCVYVAHTRNASMLVDGKRYFWLDDDQLISMRYARNLVEGHGLVWNPGERVEGYSNLGWLLVMAAVHLLPLPDRLTSLGVIVVSWLICLGVLAYAARLIAQLEPRRLWMTLPAVMLCIAGCTDVMFWATSGFETIFVTLLHLSVVVGAVGRKPLDWKILVPLALIPIARSDGMHIWLGDALLLLWMSERRVQTARALAVTLVPFAAHVVFRLAYYGDIFPNTYYLKVDALDGRWGRGLGYGKNFVRRYWLVLIFAVGSAVSMWRRDRRSLALFTSVLPPLLFSMHVGGDVFRPFRFLGHVMPELMVWAALGAARFVATPFARAAWLLALTIFVVPLVNIMTQLAPVGINGDPYLQIVVAAQLRKNADPTSSVAVIPAGMVPYFSRLESIDILGKTDHHIARLAPREGAIIGHGKMDVDYSLSKNPDYVVSLRRRAAANASGPTPSEGSFDYVWELLSNETFRRKWENNPIPDPFLLERTAVYVASDSPELPKLKHWQGVETKR